MAIEKQSHASPEEQLIQIAKHKLAELEKALVEATTDEEKESLTSQINEQQQSIEESEREMRHAKIQTRTGRI